MSQLLPIDEQNGEQPASRYQGTFYRFKELSISSV